MGVSEKIIKGLMNWVNLNNLKVVAIKEALIDVTPIKVNTKKDIKESVWKNLGAHIV